MTNETTPGRRKIPATGAGPVLAVRKDTLPHRNGRQVTSGLLVLLVPRNAGPPNPDPGRGRLKALR